MAYGTLAGIKEWLPEVTGTTFDTELTNIQTAVFREIQMKIRREGVDPDNLSTELINELADIENQWSAGVFRLRRQKDDLFTNVAKNRLDQFISSRFRVGFFKTSLRYLKSFISRPQRGKVIRFG